MSSIGGSSLQVSSGWGIIYGRCFSIEQETLLAGTSTDGSKKGRLILKIDLSAAEQPIKFVTQVADELSELTQEDLNEGGAIYELPLAEYSVDEVSVSNLVNVSPRVQPFKELVAAVQAEIASMTNKEFVTVTLMASNWQQSGDGVYYWQSVSLLGMTDTWIPDSPCFNPDIYGAPENIKWAEVALQVQELAKINAVQSYNGGLNFVCFEETPTWDIYLRVPRLGGRAN